MPCLPAADVTLRRSAGVRTTLRTEVRRCVEGLRERVRVRARDEEDEDGGGSFVMMREKEGI